MRVVGRVWSGVGGLLATLPRAGVRHALWSPFKRPGSRPSPFGLSGPAGCLLGSKDGSRHSLAPTLAAVGGRPFTRPGCRPSPVGPSGPAECLTGIDGLVAAQRRPGCAAACGRPSCGLDAVRPLHLSGRAGCLVERPLGDVWSGCLVRAHERASLRKTILLQANTCIRTLVRCRCPAVEFRQGKGETWSHRTGAASARQAALPPLSDLRQVGLLSSWRPVRDGSSLRSPSRAECGFAISGSTSSAIASR